MQACQEWFERINIQATWPVNKEKIVTEKKEMDVEYFLKKVEQEYEKNPKRFHILGGLLLFLVVFVNVNFCGKKSRRSHLHLRARKSRVQLLHRNLKP